MMIGANTAVSTAEYGIVAMCTVSRVVNLRPGANPERIRNPETQPVRGLARRRDGETGATCVQSQWGVPKP